MSQDIKATGSAKRIFFITGERGVGKSSFLAALMQTFALQPSGFITQKEESDGQTFVYIHPVIDGMPIIRYSVGNCVGLCRSIRPAGIPKVFDTYGVKLLHQAVRVTAGTDNPAKRIILMDELGTMESTAEHFCREVCHIFSFSRVIGVIKPQGTVFLPILKKIPEAVIFPLAPENRGYGYTKLKNAQTFEDFLDAVG